MHYNAPCKKSGIDCPDRSSKCRESCHKWAEYRHKVDSEAEARRKAAQCDADWWAIRKKGKDTEKLGVSNRYVH